MACPRVLLAPRSPQGAFGVCGAGSGSLGWLAFRLQPARGGGWGGAPRGAGVRPVLRPVDGGWARVAQPLSWSLSSGGAAGPTLSGCPPAPQVERAWLCLEGGRDRRLGRGPPWAVCRGGLREARELTRPPPDLTKAPRPPRAGLELAALDHGAGEACTPGPLSAGSGWLGLSACASPSPGGRTWGPGLGELGKARPPPSLRPPWRAETHGSRPLTGRHAAGRRRPQR